MGYSSKLIEFGCVVTYLSINAWCLIGSKLATIADEEETHGFSIQFAASLPHFFYFFMHFYILGFLTFAHKQVIGFKISDGQIGKK